jgi:two-component system, NtrC family, sensor kinase
MLETVSLPAHEAALRAEITRLNKMVTALMNRAEREASTRSSNFGLFQDAVILENQIRRRTAELETALRENERINRDLTREREEQRRLIQKLEEAHRQLLQSERLASIGQLAAGVAHEVNNPIGFVNSNLGTLKKYVEQLLGLLDEYALLEPAASPALRQRIEEAKQRAELDFLREDLALLIAESMAGAARVRRIVQDLRDFSRPGDSAWQTVDLHAALESTLNVVGNEINYKADVVREYGQLPLVECQPFQLNQVFLNLLLNAGQAIAQRGVITLRTACEGNWISIAVTDTGCGMTPETRDHVFDPFFTTQPVGKGTGLGLSVAYGIVEQHGGHIDVVSEPGKGSTFTVRLPVSRATAI